MSRRNNILFSMVLVSLTVLGVGILLLSGKESIEEPTYSLGHLTRGKLKAEVSATGTLSPVNTVQVGSQVSGTIQHLFADFNSEVKKDQLIAQIEPSIFEAKLAEADANVRSSEAALEKSAVAVEETKNKLFRVRGLFKKQLASDNDLDEARFAYKSAIAEQQLRRAALAQAQAARQREQVNLAYTAINTPIDGVVISRSVDVGQTVAASLQAPTLFTIAKDLTQMRIEADVDEAFIGRIKEQQIVRFNVFAYPDREFSGRVSQVRLEPKVEAGVVKYNCIIQVDNSDMALKPGMTATVAIETAHKDGVLKVPNAALRYVPDWPTDRLKKLRGNLHHNEAILWTLKDDAIQPVKVQVGIVSERETEVISTELPEGMAILLPPKRSQSKRGRRFGLSIF